MSRRLRFIPPNGLVEVTCRTIQGRHLLRPGRRLNETVIGILARAKKRYRVAVCDFSVLSNHYHLLLVPESALELARFMDYFNSNLAREAGRLHDWRSRFWQSRYSSTAITDEEAAQVGRLRYVLSQGCKEGLVASPLDWPGASSVHARLADLPLVGRWIDRTGEYRARRRGLAGRRSDFQHEGVLELSPLPCWAHLDPAAYRARYAELVQAIETDARHLVAETGRLPAGAEEVMSRHPHFRPDGVKESPAPLVHAVTKTVRQHFRETYGMFVRAYRDASERLRAGLISGTDLAFPEGCFPPPMPFVESG